MKGNIIIKSSKSFFFFFKKCTICKDILSLSDFGKSSRSPFGISYTCKSCQTNLYKKDSVNAKLRAKKYIAKNRDLHNKKCALYRKKNKKKISDYWRKRRDNEPLLRLKNNIRRRTLKAFNGKGFIKGSSKKLLGCDYNFLLKYIEKQFQKGMNWNNYGEWHLDHIIPLASAKTEERLIELSHYSNLQPLWAKENIVKSDHINGQQNKLRL